MLGRHWLAQRRSFVGADVDVGVVGVVRGDGSGKQSVGRAHVGGLVAAVWLAENRDKKFIRRAHSFAGCPLEPLTFKPGGLAECPGVLRVGALQETACRSRV